MVKLYLNSPSSGLYSCPLAMTDGAAKIVEVSLKLQGQVVQSIISFNKLLVKDLLNLPMAYVFLKKNGSVSS